MSARATARRQTVAEEVLNALSHGAGLLLAVAALPIAVQQASARGRGADVVAASVFGATMIVLYAASTLYHAMPAGGAKRWLNRVDHAAIYLFIAGSYMPFVLGVLRGAWGWTLFGITWGIAALGVAAKLLDRLRHPLWSTSLYVVMGWCALVAIAPLVQRLPGNGLAWLLAGGISYTAGVAAYLLDERVRYAHFVWHLFVLGGSGCHTLAVVRYAF